MNIHITIGGSGTRLKNISYKDKHLLYYKNKRIIEWILDIIPNANIIGERKTNNRKETLSLIQEKKNILIIDCDIIPFGFNLEHLNTEEDCVYVFDSAKNKYGSVILDRHNKIINYSEINNISQTKCSGIYFIKDLNKLLDKMEDNSIVSGMIGANTIFEKTFIKLGDAEDYFEAIKTICL